MQEKESKNSLENRERRVFLLVKPSTHKAIKEIAEKKETSVNNLINIILEKHIKRELKKERELEA